MENTNGKSILLLDPATPWGNDYHRLTKELKAAGFDVYIHGIVPLKDRVQYAERIDECILLLEMCDVLLKPQNDIVDYWLAELFSNRDVGLQKILNYAKSNKKIVVQFNADWTGCDPRFDSIYFADDAKRIVAEIKSKLASS